MNDQKRINRLFQQDLGTMRKSEWIGCLIYWPFFLIISQIIAVWIMMLYSKLSGKALSEGSMTSLASAVFEVINATALALICRHYLADQFRRLKARGWKALGDVGLDFLLYLALILMISTPIQLLLEQFHLEAANENQEAVESAIRAIPWLSIATACVLAPFVEEILNRGLIFRGLYKRSPALGYIVSMLLFALIHVYQYIPSQHPVITIVNIISYLPACFVLARVYERSGSIFPAMLLHCCINIFSTLITLL